MHHGGLFRTEFASVRAILESFHLEYITLAIFGKFHMTRTVSGRDWAGSTMRQVSVREFWKRRITSNGPTFGFLVAPAANKSDYREMQRRPSDVPDGSANVSLN